VEKYRKIISLKSGNASAYQILTALNKEEKVLQLSPDLSLESFESNKQSNDDKFFKGILLRIIYIGRFS
jgi:hypothetical protein